MLPNRTGSCQGALALLSGTCIALRIGYPYVLEWMEGNEWYFAFRLAGGLPDALMQRIQHRDFIPVAGGRYKPRWIVFAPDSAD